MKGKLEYGHLHRLMEDKKVGKVREIQKRIVSFLVRRRKYIELNDEYRMEKIRLKERYDDAYKNIINAQNEVEIKKISTFNRYKYGFACSVFIIHLGSPLLSLRYHPHQIASLFARFNKHR